MLEIIFITFIIFILALAVILHECAHGWLAYQLGDPTAKLAGRLTLNPFKHIDPLGTIIFPGILLILRHFGVGTVVFGWAKPVPVNFSQLRHPKQDMIWVAIAGPLVNILLAVVFSQILRWTNSLAIGELMKTAVFINLLLAVFNLIPIPPLDGSRVVMGLLPMRWAQGYSRLENYGMAIVLILLSLGFLGAIILPIVKWAGALLGVSLG